MPLQKLMGIAKRHNERVKPPSAFARDVMSQNNGFECISVAVRYSHGNEAASLGKPAFVAPARMPLPPMIDPILALSPLQDLSPPPPLEFSSSSDSSSLHSNQSYGLPSTSYGAFTPDPMFAGMPFDSPSAVSYQPWDIQDFSMVNTDEGEWGA